MPKPVAQPGSAICGMPTTGVPAGRAPDSVSPLSASESVADTAGMLKLVANVGSAICGIPTAGDAGAAPEPNAGAVPSDSSDSPVPDVGVTAGMLKLVANVGSAI